MIHIIVSLCLLQGCKDAKKPSIEAQENQYLYFDQWKIKDDQFENWVKAQPKEVITRSYAVMDSSLLEPVGKLHDEYIYRFNNKGYCVYLRRNVYQDTTEAFYSYTDSGYQFREDQLTNAGREKTTIRFDKSLPVNRHSYRTLTYEKKELTDSSLTSFQPEGKVTISWPSYDQNSDSEERWYLNGRLVKIVYTEEGIGDTTYYNRDENGILLSVISKEERNIYRNNEKGDPILHLKYMGNKLYSETRVHYEYDEHGNWIRRFWITEPRAGIGFTVGQFQIREIKYR
jgi:hypothetical protein